jgi:hypothetical protein
MVSFVEIDRHMFDLRKRDFVSRVHIFVEIERHALIFFLDISTCTCDT